MSHSEFAFDAAAPAEASSQGSDVALPELDVVDPTSIDAPAHAAPTETKRVLWKSVDLVYQSTDEFGFGRAVDPATRDEFMLNPRSVGFNPQTIRAGDKFQASVTRAHFVQKITSRPR